MSDFASESYSESPGTSTAKECESDPASQSSEESKIQLKTALVYCEQLLLKNNYIATEPSAVIEEEHVKIGEKIYDKILEMVAENRIVTEDDLIMFEEPDDEGLFKEVKDTAPHSDDEYQPDEKRAKTDLDHVPLDYKIKVVNMAKAHPKWTLKSIQRKGGSRLKRMDQLKIWEQQIRSGGTTKDKYDTIDTWTHDRFVEARQSNRQVTTRNLQQWALAAASQFPELQFKASDAWVQLFKRRHRIRQRKITKYVSERETATMEGILASAQRFRIQTRALIPKYDEDFVINTDQTECRYQSTYNRASNLAERTDMNTAVTHSYTAQYSMTLSGKLLPTVFICLQETSGKFVRRVQQSVGAYVETYKNIVVRCSKSGKLTTSLYRDFLTDVMKPYVKEKKFLLLVDSWEGQTNPVLYDEIFTDEGGMPTCSIKVIPSKCTGLVQPCDVYFSRQVNNFIERIQNSAYVIEKERDMTSREDCIKIQSLVHHQMSAPIFCDMLQYAWFAAKLCDERRSFMNVNQVCFATEVLKNPCECGNKAFITCARCRNNYCFPCFYDQYHPSCCSATSSLE